MEPFQAFGGLGIVGIVLVAGVAFCLSVVQPWWAIVDVVRSERSVQERVLLAALLAFTWCIGSVLYGLFATRSRTLRTFTAITLLWIVPAALVGGTAVLRAIKTLNERSQQEARANLAREAADAAAFRPYALEGRAIAPFRALHFVFSGPLVPQSAALAEYTDVGPRFDGAAPIDRLARQLAFDRAGGRTFAISYDGFGTIQPSSGRFASIAVDPAYAADLDSPAGVAFLPESGEVLVLCSHVTTGFLAYRPADATWRRLALELQGVQLAGLAYDGERAALYSLEDGFESGWLRKLHRFNRDGVHVAAVGLDPPIPVGRRYKLVQLVATSSRSLAVLLPPYAPGSEQPEGEPRLFFIDPESGRVAAHGDDTRIATVHEPDPRLGRRPSSALAK